MARRVAFLIVSLYLLLGCAPARPPLAPMMLLVHDGPNEYTVRLPQWQPSTVVTYQIHNFAEVRIADQVRTSDRRHEARLSAVDHTAQGYLRVRVAIDGSELGHLLVDGQGLLVDAIIADPKEKAEAESLLRITGSQLFKELLSKPLRLGEPLSLSLPSTWLLDMLPPEYRAGFPETIPWEIEFKGYARLNAAVAAVLTGKSPNILTSRYFLPSKPGRATAWLEEIRAEEWTDYYDPVSARLLVEYGVTVLKGQVDRFPVSMRIISLHTLDRAKSRDW